MFKHYRFCLVGALCWFAFASAASAQMEEEYRDRINRGTVGIVSGGVDGTYVRVASDLANVLDDDNLRVIAVIGKGSVQNIDDLLYLRGIDIGIVQSDVLTFVKRQGTHPTIGERIRFITKLYNEEFHLLANERISSVEELAGEKVNFGLRKSGTFMTASIIFETLGIEVEPVSFDQELAVEKVKSGELAALVYVAGKPTRLFENIGAEDNVRFLDVPLSAEILDTYLPSRLTHEDYPQLVPSGGDVKTLAIGAVMAVYNWRPATERFAKVSRFVDTFFNRFDEFQSAPRHPKWKEVNLASNVPGWTRYTPAEEWLKLNLSGEDSSTSEVDDMFEQFAQEQGVSAGGQLTEEEAKQLFDEFLRWYNQRN